MGGVVITPDKKWSANVHGGIPDWLGKMIHNREAAREAFTSDYDSELAPYKREIDKLARRRRISMLKATGEFITLQKNMNAHGFNQMDEMAALAAGLDLAEAEEGLE